MKLQRGDYGYLTYRKKIQLIKVAIGVVLVLAVLITGIVTTGSRNNLLTVGSVLLVLPTANFTVNLIAMWPYKTIKKEDYDTFMKVAAGHITASDMVITANQKLVPIALAVFHESGIIAYTSSDKVKLHGAETDVNALLKSIGMGTTMKYTNDWKAFIKKVEVLHPAEEKAIVQKLEERKQTVLIYSM